MNIKSEKSKKITSTLKDPATTYYKLAKKTIKKALQNLVLAQDLITTTRWDYLADKIIDVIEEDDALNPSAGELMAQGDCYCRYKGLKIWRSINRAILDLLANDSLTLVTAHNLVVGFLIQSLDKKGLLSSYQRIPKGVTQPIAIDIDGCGHWDITDKNGIKVMEVDYKGKVIWKQDGTEV